MKNSEERLMSLIRSTQVLTSILDIHKILKMLIEEATNVIEGADGGVLFLYDPKEDRLLPESAVGFNWDYMKQIKLRKDEGMSGKTFSSLKANVYTYSRDTEEGMANLDEDNQKYYQLSRGKLQYPTSTLCVPLVSKGKCIGVLTIDSFSDDFNFTQSDLTLLETFAAQSTIAIENATLFSQNQRSFKIHDELTKVALAHGTQEITETLANLVEKKACLFNEFLDLLAFSDQTGKEWGVQAKTNHFKELKSILLKGETASIYTEIDSNKTELYCFPIKHDDISIGLLIIFVEEKTEFDPLDLIAIEQASTIFSLEVARNKEQLFSHYTYKGYLLELLLEKNYRAIQSTDEGRLLSSGNHQYIFVDLELQDPRISYEDFKRNKNQFRHLLYRELKLFHYKSFILERNMTFYFLFIVPHNSKYEDIINELKKLFKRITEKSMEYFQLQIGVGRAADEIEGIQASKRDAELCILFLKRAKLKENFYTYSELGVHRLFLNQNHQDLQEYKEDKIGPILAYDNKNNTELYQTLLIYLNSDRSLVKTAETLFVHVNTVKYRMEQLKKILPPSPLDKINWFEIQLAIYIHEYLISMSYIEQTN